MKTRLLIWVTSDCNLKCKWCSQRYTMDQHRGYQMTMYEVIYIVQSCLHRGIYFETIELTGGEPSLWEHLEEGTRYFEKICNEVTLVTNGNNPERIIALDLKRWIVSSSQATRQQVEKYTPVRTRVWFNNHNHKPMPDEPIADSLPASCCVSRDPFTEEPQINMLYLQGKVWFCCNAYALSEKAGVTEDLWCHFENDFMGKFTEREFDKAICSYCLCNGKIWEKI